METIFELSNILVKYGGRVAVSDLTLKVDAGQALALLGLNGAGKSTTIRVLLGIQKPRQGSVRILGNPVGSFSAFSSIGYSPEDGCPPEFLNGAEYLDFVGGFRCQEKNRLQGEIEDLLNWFELDPKKKIRDYSKGMKRRLLLAQALIGSPKFLVLDEPFNGLDPLMIRKLRDRLESFRKMGGAVLLSTHILAEVEKMCTHVAIIHQGELKVVDTCAALLASERSLEEAFSKRVLR